MSDDDSVSKTSQEYKGKTLIEEPKLKYKYQQHLEHMEEICTT